MDYFTTNGVILRTGYHEVKYWYLLCIKELLDNTVDFLWKYYRGHKGSVVGYITLSDSLLKIKIVNTNPLNIPAFQHPELIFNPDMRYGSKQDVKIISRGMLGDALKQILAFSYVIIHSSDDGTAFTDEQWNHPLIIRRNGIETHIRIVVDKANQDYKLDIKDGGPVEHLDTEIEVSLPVRTTELHISDIDYFCSLYPLLATDISFKFFLKNEQDRFENNNLIEIDCPTLHPISTTWNNSWSINTLMPDEFVSLITAVYDKKNTTVYDRLSSAREGNRVKKTAENMMSVADFMKMPDYHTRLEKIFWDMKTVLPPPKKLSLPYSDINRKDALMMRLSTTLPNFYSLLDPTKAVYKIIHGNYKKDEGILEYPFSIESLVVPYSLDSLKEGGEDVHRASAFIGTVNYSLPPTRSNKFEGNYKWFDKKKKFTGIQEATSMKELLQTLGFSFSAESAPKIKIPSIIFVNIICQRIDYHGHDKSRIDTVPFSDVIIQTAKKLAESVKTFQGEGFTFDKREMEKDEAPKEDRKMTAKSLVEIFLDRIRTGSSLDITQGEGVLEFNQQEEEKEEESEY